MYFRTCFYILNNIYTDKELIFNLSKSDRKAYRFAYLKYYNNLCVYLLSFTHDKYKAEDIAQNVLLTLWEKRSNLNIHTSLKSYLYKSAYNAFIDEYRSTQKINKKLEQIKFDGLNIIDDEDYELKEKRAKDLREAIKQLPPRCKEVITLSKIEGYKYKEISDILDISVKTVENHMSNGFKLLKKKLLSNKLFLFFLNFSLKKIKTAITHK